jgi:2,3-bisphosphoglycerate-independent phosphoglycerate mutase
MSLDLTAIQRPVALVILDGWGYAPRTEGNAIAIAHTPVYDTLCRDFPMTTLAASGQEVGQAAGERGNAEIGHLAIGTGRIAQTELSRIRNAIVDGSFPENEILKGIFTRSKASGADLHLIGMVSDGDVHSSTESLFALLRMAKSCGLSNVYVHTILDGLDVAPRTADVYVDALEIKMADIGVGRIATLCGRYFAMDAGQNWERTARAYTMLVHGEGERTTDAAAAIHNSFLRGISDEFIAPIVLERSPDVPVATIKNGDAVIFFNHRGDAMRQLVRSVAVPDSGGPKPMVDTVCLTEYDRVLDLPAAFCSRSEKNSLAEVLSHFEVPNFKITETERFRHLTHFFDGGGDVQYQLEHQILVPASRDSLRYGQPESESFKIADKVLRALESSSRGVFVVNFPAADLMAASNDLAKTVAAIQFVDTCLGGICEKMHQMGGVTLVTSTHGNCEDMADAIKGEPRPIATRNPVPFHFVDPADGMRLRDDGNLADVAPTILSVLGIETPSEMTGSDLRQI